MPIAQVGSVRVVITDRELKILDALRAGAWLEYPYRRNTTWRLRRPTDAWHGGEVVQARTIAKMREKGLLTSDWRPVP